MLFLSYKPQDFLLLYRRSLIKKKLNKKNIIPPNCKFLESKPLKAISKIKKTTIPACDK